MDWVLFAWLVAGSLLGALLAFCVNLLTTITGKKKIVVMALVFVGSFVSAGVAYRIMANPSVASGHSLTPVSTSQRYITTVDGEQVKFVIHFADDGNARAVVDWAPEVDYQTMCVKIKLYPQSLGRTLTQTYACGPDISLRQGAEHVDEVLIEISGQPDVISCTRDVCKKTSQQ